MAIDDERVCPDRMVAGYVDPAGVTWLDRATDERGFPTARTVVCFSAAGRWITAACVAILVRQGDLDPNLPVRAILPELPAWAASIRLHHLVHHTSGLAERPGMGAVDADWSYESVLRRLSEAPRPAAAPGTQFTYSGIGYACLTAVAERASGRPIAEVARKHLFEPLGMVSTRFWKGRAPRLPPATAGTRRDQGRPAPNASDGVWSTARDMLRWAEAMQTGALGPRLTALLRAPGRLRHGAAVPYSWGSFILSGERGPAFAHGGWWPGCFTYVIASPATSRSAVVVAFTDDPQPAEKLGRRLVGLDMHEMVA